jgi:hypothetical protein
MYLKSSLKIRKKCKPSKIKSKQHFSFKIGDMVRISHLKTEFGPEVIPGTIYH